MAVLRIGSLLFRLHPGAVLITLLAIAIMIKLGFWQIDRGQEKQAIIDQHAQGVASEIVQVEAANLEYLAEQPDRVVQLTATFSPDRYFLIDNQMHQGRAGYHVLALASSPQLDGIEVPVNLGWVPGGVDRQQLPDVALPEGEVYVQGRIRLPAEKPFMLAEQEFTQALPQRIQYPELGHMNAEIEGVQLAPLMILLDEELDWGFPREWPVVVMTPHRHYAYAVQWFGLALAALVIFLVASRQRPNRPENKEK